MYLCDPGVRSKAGEEPAIRIDTQGFACTNRQCQYFGNTDARVHAAFGRWQARSCRADPDVPLPEVPHHLHAPVAIRPCID
jgi:hypothetical protein